jgi:hypothetical protein
METESTEDPDLRRSTALEDEQTDSELEGGDQG